MQQKKVVILRGLPASGKSVYAAQLVMQKRYKRLNKDDLRAMLDNETYSRNNEDFINSILYCLMDFILENDWNVVIDNTNFNNKYVLKYKEIAKKHNAEVEIVDIDVPLQTCINRDLERDQGRVGKEVITKIYNRHFKNGKFPEKP